MIKGAPIDKGTAPPFRAVLNDECIHDLSRSTDRELEGCLSEMQSYLSRRQNVRLYLSSRTFDTSGLKAHRTDTERRCFGIDPETGDGIRKAAEFIGKWLILLELELGIHDLGYRRIAMNSGGNEQNSTYHISVDYTHKRMD